MRKNMLYNIKNTLQIENFYLSLHPDINRLVSESEENNQPHSVKFASILRNPRLQLNLKLQI